MTKKSYIAEYETDIGKVIILKLNYFTDNAEQRLSDGGLTALPNECSFALGRKFIKPRYVILNYSGSLQKVICKTKTKMIELINNNDNIISYCGECLSACGLNYIKD